MKATLFVLCSSLFALTSGAVSLIYRGVVSDNDGNVLAEGVHTVVFRLYENSAGTTDDALVTQTHESVAVDAEGAFQRTIDLAGCEGLILSNRLNYVGLSVDGAAEIQPRQRILPQPYANRAAVADRIAAGGTVAHVEAQDLDCRKLVGGIAAEVVVLEELKVGEREIDAPLRIGELDVRTLTVRATLGMTVFADGWRPLDETWWSGDWSSLKRGKVPTDGTLTVGNAGAYFISSLGESAREEYAAAQYAQLLKTRNTIWRMPGIAFFGRPGDRIDDAFDKIFKSVCVEVGRNTDAPVPPQVKAAYLPYVGQEGGAE